MGGQLGGYCCPDFFSAQSLNGDFIERCFVQH